jgi:hypothetical protein
MAYAENLRTSIVTERSRIFRMVQVNPERLCLSTRTYQL